MDFAGRQPAADNVPEAYLQHSKGVLAARQGAWKEARKSFEKSLRLGRDDPDAQLELLTIYELGIVAFEDGKLSEALERLNHVLGEAQQLGQRLLEQSALYELGIIAANHTHDFSRARELLTEALEIARELNHGRKKLNCVLGLADADYEEGLSLCDTTLIRRANEAFGYAMEEADEARIDFLKATAAVRRARCRLALGLTSEAAADLQVGLAIAKDKGFKMLQIEALSLMKVDGVATEGKSRTLGRNPRNKPCPCGSGKKYKRCCGV